MIGDIKDDFGGFCGFMAACMVLVLLVLGFTFVGFHILEFK